MTKRRSKRTASCPVAVIFCFNCCTAKFHFQGDKLINVTGNDEDPVLNGKICPKAQFTLQLHHNEHRLEYPLKRVGRRGENKFERITWDQALDEIAAKLEVLRERWGTEALAMFVGTRTGLITQKGYARLFSQMWGTPNLQGTDPFCAAGKVVAYEVTHGINGNGNSYTPGDIGSAGMYLYVGDNQAETRPVYFGKVNDWRIRNKTKMVVVDPRYTATASKADKWFAIRPGTDMALGLAMAHHIFSEDLHDARFCEEWVLGWERWRDFIFEKGYTPDWAETVTGISAEDIRTLAGDVARADGCVIFGSRGLNQHTNSVQTNRAFMFVAAITGNWGRKGGAYVNMTAGPAHRRQRAGGQKSENHEAHGPQEPGGLAERHAGGQAVPHQGVSSLANNPLAQWPGQDEARAAFQALDLIVPHRVVRERDLGLCGLRAARGGRHREGRTRPHERRQKSRVDRQDDRPAGRGEARWLDMDRTRQAPGLRRCDEGGIQGPGQILGRDVHRQRFPARRDAETASLGSLAVGALSRRERGCPRAGKRFYLEGTTATGQPEGKRFPTPSGRLEFWTEALEEKFSKVGLSALPEFYSEKENLLGLPYLEFETRGWTTWKSSPRSARRPRVPALPESFSRMRKT